MKSRDIVPLNANVRGEKMKMGEELGERGEMIHEKTPEV
jgi:hypothetical protein